MFYIILEKNISTDTVRVHSVYEDSVLALNRLDELVDSTVDYGYRMDSVAA